MSPGESWRPAAALEVARLRAGLLAKTRAFFESRGVLEVETPLLGAATATDPHLASLTVTLGGERFFLQTSPEFAMKRLLAAGFGPIYQICRAFRDGEVGTRHNPEFTLLEWYRPGWNERQLMDEVDAYLRSVLGTEESTRDSYAELFERHVGLDPHRSSAAALAARARELGLPEVSSSRELEREDWLHLLMAEVVEPRIGRDAPQFVYDFPEEMKALARLRPGEPRVAERFELYFRGLELANGYHELTGAAEQRERFRRDLETRARLGCLDVRRDERLLQALEHGLPDSAGVALGLDRLVMIAAGATSIRSVLNFPIDLA